MAGVRIRFEKDNRAGVKANAHQAIRRGMNTTLAEAAAHTQLPFPAGVRRLTGALANDMSFEAATERDGNFTGSFGGYTLNYVLWRNLRDHFLENAADFAFPSAADNIRAEM